MQRIKSTDLQLWHQVNMETLVASDHYYRRLDAAIDWTFLYKETEGVYGTEGREREM